MGDRVCQEFPKIPAWTHTLATPGSVRLAGARSVNPRINWRTFHELDGALIERLYATARARTEHNCRSG